MRVPLLFGRRVRRGQGPVALDAFFGIDGPITYKKNGLLRDLVAGLPPDRIVIETDSPFFAPRAVSRQNRTSRPCCRG